jgi:signal transduction histidine kinase
MYFAYPDDRTIGWPVLTIGTILWAATGALIVSRHPGHRVGWLFVATGVIIGVDDPLIMYADNILGGGDLGPLRAGQIAAWLVSFIDLPLPGLLISLVFLLFPTGDLPSPRWRAVLWVVWGSFVLFTAVTVFAVDPRDIGPETMGAGPVAQTLLGISRLGFLVGLAASAVAVVARMRHAHGERRQQLRWLATAGAALGVAVVPPVVAGDIEFLGGLPGWALLLPLHLAFAGVALAAGFAILRYRLYDIDLIISRAIVLAVVTVFVTAGYVAVVVAIGAVLGERTAGAFWPSLVATALVAVAFQPVRASVQRLADRAVYGARAAPYEALSEFIAKLGNSPSVSELLPCVAEATARSVAARRSQVVLHLPDGQQLMSVWPPATDGSDDLELAVTDRGETVGQITLSTAPGHHLRPSDRRLLADFTSQLGLAFRNARLEADLQVRVRQVTRRTEELAISRRRLVAARDDERRRLSSAIDRQVLCHLRPLVDDLQASARATAGDEERMRLLLDRQIEAANAGLGELRRLSHGAVPAVLRRRGLAAALVATGAGLDVQITSTAEPRFDAQIETAAYLCARAALSGPGSAKSGRIVLTADSGKLAMTVPGIDEQVPNGPDWPSVVDRVEALGGKVVVISEPGGAPTVRLDLPLPPAAGHAEPAQTDRSVSGPKADFAR